MAENVENITNEGAEKAPEKTQETTKYESPKLSWWDKHGTDVIGGGLALGTILFLFGCINSADKTEKINAKLYEKQIDAALEAAKYQADKQAEIEMSKTSDIKDIVHDITNMKN